VAATTATGADKLGFTGADFEVSPIDATTATAGIELGDAVEVVGEEF
jgi:hypothetical protein